MKNLITIILLLLFKASVVSQNAIPIYFNFNSILNRKIDVITSCGKRDQYSYDIVGKFTTIKQLYVEPKSELYHRYEVKIFYRDHYEKMKKKYSEDEALFYSVCDYNSIIMEVTGSLSNGITVKFEDPDDNKKWFGSIMVKSDKTNGNGIIIEEQESLYKNFHAENKIEPRKIKLNSKKADEIIIKVIGLFASTVKWADLNGANRQEFEPAKICLRGQNLGDPK